MRTVLKSIASVVVVVVGLGVGAGSARGQCIAEWRVGSSETFPGVNGTVTAMVVHDDGRGSAVYIGGDFTVAGTADVVNVARWDGTVWEAVGDGFSDPVRALASYQGDLYAGGDFDWSGTRSVRSIARLPAGSGAWTEVDGGVSGRVNALAVNGGRLYVGGVFSGPGFTASANLAAWDGSAWVSAAPQFTPEITTMTVWDGKIVAAGASTFDRTRQRNIATLVGLAWMPLGRVTTYDVRVLTVHNGELIAGGDFETIGGVAARGVARWDGTAWGSLGDGSVYTQAWQVRSLASQGGALYAGGRFVPAVGSGTYTSFLMRWDGAAWATEMNDTEFLEDGVMAMTPYGGRLIVGGDFSRLGEVEAYSLAARRASGLAPVSNGMTGPVHQLYKDGTDVLAVGDFVIDGAHRVAKLDGDQWTALPGSFNGATQAVVRSGGSLIAGGYYSKVDGVAIGNIARRTASGWEPMGEGFNLEVRALTEYRGEVIAAGVFTRSGAETVRRVARWDGSAWRGLGNGLNGNVAAAVVYQDRLIVGGNFTQAGETAVTNIAAWDGEAWSSVGSGLLGTPPVYAGQLATVSALYVHHGELYAAGDFVDDDRVPCGVARWDGAEWRRVGDVPVRGVGSLTVYQGLLTAAGLSLAQWDGAAWVMLSEGFDRIADDLYPIESRARALLPNGRELLVGGSFTRVGGRSTPPSGVVSSFFARWGCAPCVADLDDDGIVDFSDYLAYLSLFDAQDPAADLTGDGMVDFSDYLGFIDAYSGGCA